MIKEYQSELTQLLFIIQLCEVQNLTKFFKMI